mgnify:CR=1 FL=1
MEITLSRKDRERLHRRNDILQAAQEVFAEKGYNQATLEQLALKAEFGKGTLYNYFPGGKQEILLSIFEALYDQLCELIALTFEKKNGHSFRLQLHQLIEEMHSFFHKKLDLFVILIREAHRLTSSDDPAPQVFFSQQRNRAIDALAVPIARAAKNSEIKFDSPHFLAHMIMVNINGVQMKSCKGMSYDYDDESGPHTSREMADFLTTMILDGLGNPDNAAQTQA